MVGMVGFEPTTLLYPKQAGYQAAPHPVCYNYYFVELPHVVWTGRIRTSILLYPKQAGLHIPFVQL